MSPAYIGGGFHSRLLAVGYNLPPKPGGAKALLAPLQASARPDQASLSEALLSFKCTSEEREEEKKVIPKKNAQSQRAKSIARINPQVGQRYKQRCRIKL